ncbi:IclR family transcriptional regulator [Actinomadura madurae]|uniref:IclR family transcriptional regulator n=2 Tax=Actinomadura madurae TaxID=1993 RepID=UPI0020264B7A|nr:IclR family transcriptional regulator [Actinomadura madurae]URM93823.1 IclR family transcriptional regulator [Actinomadura madurae]
MKNMKEKPTYALGSVDNALLILHMLRDQGSLKVSDVARELNIARSTAHRLLAMLVYRDFAIQDERHSYLPGPFLSSTPAGMDGSTLRELRRLATPHMETLCGRVQETVNLVVRTGTEVRFLSSVESSQVLQVGDRRGTILPAHLASGGKAMLAELPTEQLRELYPDLTGPEWTKLTRELANVRTHGHALNIEGTERGVAAIGAAVHDGSGTTVGALSIAVPLARFGPEQMGHLARELHRTVDKIEHTLTHFPGA